MNVDSAASRRRRHLWVYGGIALIVAGFALILLAWGQVAGETEVSRQLPAILWGGGLGLGCIMAGLTVTNVAARTDDAGRATTEIDRLARVLDELSSQGALR